MKAECYTEVLVQRAPMKLNSFKILGAILNLSQFTVGEVVELAGVPKGTVYTFLRRRKDVLTSEVTPVPEGAPRGGQEKTYRIKPEARATLEQELDALFASVSRDRNSQAVGDSASANELSAHGIGPGNSARTLGRSGASRVNLPSMTFAASNPTVQNISKLADAGALDDVPPLLTAAEEELRSFSTLRDTSAREVMLRSIERKLNASSALLEQPEFAGRFDLQERIAKAVLDLSCEKESLEDSSGADKSAWSQRYESLQRFIQKIAKFQAILNSTFYVSSLDESLYVLGKVESALGMAGSEVRKQSYGALVKHLKEPHRDHSHVLILTIDSHALKLPDNRQKVREIAASLSHDRFSSVGDFLILSADQPSMSSISPELRERFVFGVGKKPPEDVLGEIEAKVSPVGALVHHSLS